MHQPPLHYAAAPLRSPGASVDGGFVSLEDEPFYRIAGYDHMPPFFMSVVSASNHWMFISSNGGMTAGRRNADNALFPYYAEDRIRDDADHTGARAVLRVLSGDRRLLWEPFRLGHPRVYDVSRNLYKHVQGDTLVFEEENHTLGLTFRHRWRMSDRFGLVLHSQLLNTGREAATVELLDGVQNLLPWGVHEAFQVRFSVLGDAYKQNEVDPSSGLATYAYSSLPGDSAEPAEALRTTVCWSTWPLDGVRLLSSIQLDAFRRGRPVEAEHRIHGRRGAHFVSGTLELPPGDTRDWLTVADVEQGPVEVAELRALLHDRGAARTAVLDDVRRSSARLRRIVAGADGLQCTGDRMSSEHHFANVLFNVMRGGVFEAGYRLRTAAVESYLRQFNRATWARHRDLFTDLPPEIERARLLEAVEERNDPDLSRLVTEYLPLSFSRRHGDPSRPWNRFSIELRDADGSRTLGYEGNWRDIFQNWEALALSFPEYLDAMIGRFVNTTTADGYNPYRITHEGFDWETPNPDEPWANLGYWGDHQLVYLLKLLEWSRAHHPGALEARLRDARFVYAEVPYTIRPYDDLLADPRHSIEYDTVREARIDARVEATGFDGKLLSGPDGGPCRANLTEKLLVPLLAKVANFAPGAGIWMNTQRPEWNDANNALAGYGASVVTLCHARRYVAFVLELFGALGDDDVALHGEVADWLRATDAVLVEAHDLLGEAPLDGPTRKRVLDGVGRAAERYREGVYASGLTGEPARVAPTELRDFLGRVLEHIEHTITLNRRDDGLYHAYNVLTIGPDAIGVRHLQPMLEGQVAVLSSGALDAEASLEVLEALRSSAMYRDDQHSYMLYPDRELPGFLEKNVVPDAQVERSELLSTLLDAGDGRLVVRDRDGTVHFNPDIRNARDVERILETLRSAVHEGLSDGEAALVTGIFESVFDHQRFTGRSGTFYGYEGLGSIYWHMVGKLLVAVQETALATRSDDPDRFTDFAERYYDVRAGLGFNKSPEVYGAFPLDPYSHTPAHAGAQQPGMTGQVKEEILTRFGELGVRVDGGVVTFDPALLRRSEFRSQSTRFSYVDVRGEDRTLELPPESLAFTYAQVPVVYRVSPEERITVHRTEGTSQVIPGLTLSAAESASIFGRTGAIERLVVELAPGLEG